MIKEEQAPEVYSIKHFYNRGYPKRLINQWRDKGYLKPYICVGSNRQIGKYREVDFLNAVEAERQAQLKSFENTKRVLANKKSSRQTEFSRTLDKIFKEL